jgi:hypothetical protein
MMLLRNANAVKNSAVEVRHNAVSFGVPERRPDKDNEVQDVVVRAPFLAMYVLACLLAIGLNGPKIPNDN